MEPKDMIFVSFGDSMAGFFVQKKLAAERVYSALVDGKGTGFGASAEDLAAARQQLAVACATSGRQATAGGVEAFGGLTKGTILDILIQLLPSLLPLLLGLCPK